MIIRYSIEPEDTEKAANRCFVAQKTMKGISTCIKKKTAYLVFLGNEDLLDDEDISFIDDLRKLVESYTGSNITFDSEAFTL